MDQFIKIMENDLNLYRPETTQLEKEIIVYKALNLFQHKKNIYHISKNYISIKNIINPETSYGLFMYRKFHPYSILPCSIPNNYRIFEESSSDILINMHQTLNMLEGHSFNENDIQNLTELLDNNVYDKIIAWSHSSILLYYFIHAKKIKTQNIKTFGSPILIPSINGVNCINIYHEDDWILHLVNTMYSLDIINIDRNFLHEFIYKDQIIFLVILSANHFTSDNEPHRSFKFLL